VRKTIKNCIFDCKHKCAPNFVATPDADITLVSGHVGVKPFAIVKPASIVKPAAIFSARDNRYLSYLTISIFLSVNGTGKALPVLYYIYFFPLCYS
jgi:hypothetical protein